MKILGIDTTTNIASIALISEKEIFGEFTINYKQTHSKTILPMIENLFSIIKLDICEIDYIACTNGPGSFTGLRIGASTAKALAHGINKPIIPVPTLDILAYNNFEVGKIIVPIIDARKNQVYTSIYKNTKNGQERLSDYFNISINEIIDMVKIYSNRVVFLGDGVAKNNEILKSYRFKVCNFYHNYNRAINVCLKSLNLISKDKYVSYNNFKLIYLKKFSSEKRVIGEKTR